MAIKNTSRFLLFISPVKVVGDRQTVGRAQPINQHQSRYFISLHTILKPNINIQIQQCHIKTD